MAITAAMVKELRERTGAGMMECKKALVETAGDIEKAVEELRIRGAASAHQKSSRIAAEGIVVTRVRDNTAVTLEVNSETDFVARDDNFVAFAQAVAEKALTDNISDRGELLVTLLDADNTVAQACELLSARIGEKISVRRVAMITAESQHLLGSYQHGTRISVLVKMHGGNATLARDIAMHIAASRPLYISVDDVSPAVLARERQIETAALANSDKKPEIISRIVEGKVNRYLKQIALLNQPFIKNLDQTVGELLSENDARVLHFVCFEVGEGIDKKVADFAGEVMAQALDDSMPNN